jgi:hypothetical protein
VTANEQEAAAGHSTTARTLAIVGVACLLLGFSIGSPAGAMFLHGLAVLFALSSVLLARGLARFFSGLVLGVALAMLVVTYPAYREHMAAYATKAQR